jgi:isochorismate hydrolase
MYVTSRTIRAKTREWLEKIAPYNTHKVELTPEKSALLVIDMQKFFLDPASPTFTCGGLAIINNIKKLVRAS